MDKIKQALEAVQHIFLCEDEGMASGQPTKEDYLQARELVAAALAEQEAAKPRPEVAPECATASVIRGVHERWHELGYHDPDRAEERFRDSAWKAFYCGWVEGRWPLLVGEASKPKELTPGKGWISVEDRLPEEDTWVLVYSDTGDVGDFPFDIGRITYREWKCLGWEYPVTHWMPLPEPPNTLGQ